MFRTLDPIVGISTITTIVGISLLVSFVCVAGSAGRRVVELQKMQEEVTRVAEERPWTNYCGWMEKALNRAITAVCARSRL